MAVIVRCRTQNTVTTLAQWLVIHNQLLQRAPATDFCTFTSVIFHYLGLLNSCGNGRGGWPSDTTYKAVRHSMRFNQKAPKFSVGQ